MNFRIVFPASIKKYYWDFDSDCFESVVCFGWYGHFNNNSNFRKKREKKTEKTEEKIIQEMIEENFQELKDKCTQQSDEKRLTS